ncbi:MAG TPA: biotin--[acetyl-CoA-carboxylase] ligase [bacterium]|nr:biotin--[acetyl-CoA-carboxylase] ligase [bacterium]
MRRYDIERTPWGNFYHFAELDSTNAEAIRLIEKGISSGIVIADRQTAGRGCGGNGWFSPKGRNLYVSFFSRTEMDRSRDLAKMAGVALYETIAGVIPTTRLLLKWPNDILADRKKVAGILIQQVRRGPALLAVTGIGINIETPDKQAFAWRWEPSSLEETAGTSVSPNTVLRRLVSSLEHWRHAAGNEIDTRYDELVAWMTGRTTRWLDGGAERQGTIRRFADRHLTLIIATDNGEELALSAGEVTGLQIPGDDPATEV